MRRALIDADGVTRNIIEIEPDEESCFALRDGWRLDDAARFPLIEPPGEDA